MPKPNVRERILESGLEQMHRLGYNACSVEDITTHAGVPKGSFYNHFKSKEDLAVEVIDRYVEAKPQSYLLNTSIAPTKRLKQYFTLLTQSFVDSGYKQGCLLGNFANELADHSPQVREKLKAVFDRWTKQLAEVIEEGQERGEITSAQKPQVLASFLLSAYEGTLLRARVANDSGVLREFNAIAFSQLAA